MTATGQPAHELDEQPAEPTELSDRDRAILDLERHWFKYTGAKETVIRERFGISSTRYYQTLNVLVRRPEAMAYDPLTVKRLQRLQRERAQARSARRLGFDC